MKAGKRSGFILLLSINFVLISLLVLVFVNSFVHDGTINLG